MAKWISIKDRKPQDGVLKLLCNMNCKDLRNVMYVSWFVDGVEVTGHSDRQVTHWMDLPDYPKGQDREEGE